MGSLGIDGLVSGLNTTDLINQLMLAEAGPQRLLVSKQSSTSSMVTALQALNAKLSSLGDAATAATKTSSWAAAHATSSHSSVTATATAGAQPSTLSFTVSQVAQSQSSLVTLPSGYDTTTPSFTISQGGVDTVVTAASSDITDIVSAFNASGTGVKAAAVNVGTAAAPEYRLQLTGVETGAGKGFSLSVATGADGSGTQPLTLNDVRTAQDARLTLWAGTAFEQPVTSSTNTFSGLMAGVDVTVTQVEAEPVSLTVARDDAAVTKLATDLMGSLGVVMSEISSRTAPTTTTAADGRSIVTGGLFSGDSAVRGLQQQLQSAMAFPVDGMSPSEVGISINAKTGQFDFDEEKFAAALAADPARVEKIVSGLAARVGEVATGASDKYEGTLTLKIQSQEGMVKSLGEQIASWDLRLASRREGLQKTYAALEVSLSNLQSQSSWLTSQIASLPSTSS
ncbi:flagellar filament capping protein FliD [Cellulomonas chengniuliangii]|uniref:Flagellar hook-associated protein 2 n=1 Tax=Cellulomonas chengniuliangii TaxID=2968084 RepID=A0ABY5KZS1_9CELL|nr:flagellar filament capping protein FliD [Cellulomonas chengniuliangii]MCC2307275.1 flagellar filament capping protein FliD [Cellulomonas chengniuliangii]MCC2317829.1 flagellar filament capping protein FliD [Cellulomonas chengniuliangii]UUI75934.1 flagellar filament capping protein FliD [Cellulomonas chengniuliangii]